MSSNEEDLTMFSASAASRGQKIDELRQQIYAHEKRIDESKKQIANSEQEINDLSVELRKVTEIDALIKFRDENPDTYQQWQAKVYNVDAERSGCTVTESTPDNDNDTKDKATNGGTKRSHHDTCDRDDDEAATKVRVKKQRLETINESHSPESQHHSKVGMKRIKTATKRNRCLHHDPDTERKQAVAKLYPGLSLRPLDIWEHYESKKAPQVDMSNESVYHVVI